LEVSTHVVIPDTQTKSGVPTAHLRWIGNYLVDQFAGKNLTVIHLGDHWDMPSLSSYDKGKKAMEGRRYEADIKAGNLAFEILCAPLEAHMAHNKNSWSPRRIFLDGNHEHRVTRAAEADAQLDGLINLDHMDTRGWERYGFLEPVTVDGVCYSHYFYNPMTGRPYGGTNVESRLKTVGHSFTMGHQQGLKWGRVDTVQGPHLGLVAGSCYLHDEDYLGPQSVGYWRGIVVCHQVAGGSYDPMFVSLDFLCRKYEGMRLKTFLHRGRTR
jgi:hypothetical protein